MLFIETLLRKSVRVVNIVLINIVQISFITSINSHKMYVCLELILLHVKSFMMRDN
jgi:hypothetical protein